MDNRIKEKQNNSFEALAAECMKHILAKFKNECYELIMLKRLRDNFVSKEDIEYYCEISPIIIEAINNTMNCEDIYFDIYENVISECIIAIENEKYEKAYNIYINAILKLEEKYVKKELHSKLVKNLKYLDRK